MFDQIPVQVLEQYEGKWIVWDQDDQKVLGCGNTVDEARTRRTGEDRSFAASPSRLAARLGNRGML